jgi:hypothetical protein
VSGQEKSRVQSAKTLSDLSNAFYSSVDRGMTIRFRVSTIFKRNDDDDDRPKDASPAAVPKAAKEKQAEEKPNKGKTNKDDDDDDRKQPKSQPGKSAADQDKAPDDILEIESPFGDCGVDFEEGETYLVYATSDEDTDELSTTSCSRTRRLSDAGDDLAYLFFYKNFPEESARVEGAVTAPPPSPPNNAPARDFPRVPVPGAVIQLQFPNGIRYAESGPDGQFVFDGLRGGEYTLSAFAHGYPLETDLLAGPQTFRLNAKGCARQVLLTTK